MNKLLLLLGLTLGFNSYAQEGLAPLMGNEKLQWESKSQQVSYKVGDTYKYKYLLEKVHLPFMDDFSKNYFKQYVKDPGASGNTFQVWQKFLKDGVYVESFRAMNDTSYHFTYNSLTDSYDSVANPVVYVSNLSQTNYQTIESIDTVWTWDTLVVGNTVVTTHQPDVNYTNFSDTLVIVPDDGYSLWRNNNVLHNYTYGDDPITLGVATFDGLDSTGVPYDPTMNSNSYQIADVLESKPIYLKTRPNGGADYDYLQDSVYFSFYYQPQGLGEVPEPSDSLVLEFYSPVDDKWRYIWSMEGKPNQPFQNVNIRIKNPLYFQDGFKFRFSNYASVSGNFDHWNIDYVRLDENRSAADTTFTDVGLLDPGYSLIKDYYQMPWLHYKNSTKSHMKTEQDIRYRNVGTTSYTALSTLKVFDTGVPLFNGSIGINPQFGPLAIGSEVSTFSGVYPKTSTDTTKSFNVQFLAEVDPDLNGDNDTAFFHQQFGTQYSYDDGSAESAYYVASVGAQIAVEYDIAVKDSLRALNIYFPRSFENINDRAYRVMVWKSLEPEVILYEGFLEYPAYSGGRDLVRGILLEEPIEVEGSIYVGIKQIDKTIYIGFDVNTNPNLRNFYKIGGAWSPSSYKGSLFIRPEFGVTDQWPVSVPEVVTEEYDFKLYPNPSSYSVNMATTSANNVVVVRSMLGIEVMRFNASETAEFEVSGLTNGLYLVEVTNTDNGQSAIKKLLIQH
tara:strand:- start:107937 stop:110117 length:2181 start_codon:yes stop_codon:yes gene_type:complete